MYMLKRKRYKRRKKKNYNDIKTNIWKMNMYRIHNLVNIHKDIDFETGNEIRKKRYLILVFFLIMIRIFNIIGVLLFILQIVSSSDGK